MMRRSFNCSPCSACGIQITNKSKLPFLSRQSWRDAVADSLSYSRDFDRSLGVRSRIHAHHFFEQNVRNGKPIGVFILFFDAYLFILYSIIT